MLLHARLGVRLLGKIVLTGICSLGIEPSTNDPLGVRSPSHSARLRVSIGNCVIFISISLPKMPKKDVITAIDRGWIGELKTDDIRTLTNESLNWCDLDRQLTHRQADLSINELRRSRRTQGARSTGDRANEVSS